METAKSSYEKGLKAYTAGNFKEAAECFYEHIESNKKDASAFFYSGSSLENLAKRQDNDKELYKKAFKQYEKATKKNLEKANFDLFKVDILDKNRHSCIATLRKVSY